MHTYKSYADILSKLEIAPGSTMSRASAEAILQGRFSDVARDAMSKLQQKNSSGALTPDEIRLLDSYCFVEEFLNVMQEKARAFIPDQT